MIMENKINIAKLLKDCPQGMELDCTIWDNVVLDHIDMTRDCPIYIRIKGDGYEQLTKYGQWNHSNNAKCVIFPKGKTTWEGFQRPFKDGDIAISESGDIHLLQTSSSSYCSYRESWEILHKFDSAITTNVTIVRLATEEEKQKLFQAIKDNGYHWNEETKTLEKLVEPKFKVGDRVQNKNTNMIGTINLIINDEREYRVSLKNGGITYILFEFQDDWELVKDNSKPKFKVGDRITKRDSIVNSWIVSSVSPEYYGLQLPKGSESIGVLPVVEQDDWVLVPNKFDITTLKPYESRVLVRGDIYNFWKPAIFGFIKDKIFYLLGGAAYEQCIPYKNNEHLLGTKNDCDDFYKTWE